MPVLVLNGDSDPINPFKGGDVSILGLGSRGKVVSTHETARFFAARNQVPQTAVSGQLLDGRVQWMRWGAEDRPAVMLYSVVGGGHTIPQSRFRYPRILGRTEFEFDGPEAVWQFFSSHSSIKK
jgi:polyhydroxybutyrate depolymerase